ncbi:ATP-binding protein [Mucilaginibacter litoreus]|uniref:histidine kinase n=1 Tax=Mucilaginibacter litoreus TaxID=1048221 RepID=A0ABW3AQU2_9SPHI
MHQNNGSFIPVDEQFKLMADTAPVMMWVSGADKMRYFFSKTWLQFTGRTFEEESGEGWIQGVHPDDVERCTELLNKAYNACEEFKLEYRLKRHDGQYRWILAHGMPRFNTDGVFAGFIGSCMDIDELLESERIKKEFISAHALQIEQKLNSQLKTANAELEHINKELHQTQAMLANLNDELEEKVRVRTIELEDSEQEQQTLNEELTAINEEFAVTNEELAATNDELMLSQQKLERLVSDLKETEHRIRSLVESAPFPIGVYQGREMRIVLANQAIMDVWGKGYDVIGKTYHELLPELDNQQIYDQLDDVYITGIPFHARNQQVDIVVDGKLQPFYFNYSFTPLYDTAGNIYGVMNTAAEVTDIVLAKQRVEQSEKNLYNMILQAPVAMCILTGPQHIVEVANDMMIKLWGKPVTDVWNKPIFEGLPDSRDQGLEQLMADVYYTGQTYRASERPVSLIRNGTQEVVYQDFVYEPYRDSGGNTTGIIVASIDVTEQVLARQRIEQNLLEAQKLQKQKDGFIGIASHELKTPLTSLSAIVQVLSVKLKDNPDPFISGALSKATSQIRKMSNLINGFLDISRLEAGKIHLDKQQFRVDQLLREVADEIQITTQIHTIYVHHNSHVEVSADREKIGSVISNLLSNAVKYSPGGKRIDVSCETEDGFVKVIIKDEGMGVKEQDLNKLFDRYYRVESDHTRHISGFGIGLYLSAEIVKQHGGRIWAESESGIGSTFYFTLPLG